MEMSSSAFANGRRAIDLAWTGPRRRDGSKYLRTVSSGERNPSIGHRHLALQQQNAKAGVNLTDPEIGAPDADGGDWRCEAQAMAPHAAGSEPDGTLEKSDNVPPLLS
jgi:hypothetical protein